MAHDRPTPSNAGYERGLAAIFDGDDEHLTTLLAAEPALALVARNSPDWPDSTLLDHAVWWHRHGMVDALLAAGANAHRPGGQPRQTALQRALEMGADTLGQRLGPSADLATAAGLGDVASVERRLTDADAGELRRAFRIACLNGQRETALLLGPQGPPGWSDKAALVDALLRGRHLLTWDQGDSSWDWAAAQLELADPLNVLQFDARDGQGRTLGDAARAGGDARTIALLEQRRPAEPRHVPPARVWRPMNSPLAERFLFACQWGQTSRVRAFLAEFPSLVHTRTMWNMGALYLPGAYGSTGSTATGLVLLAAGAPPFDGIGGPAWWGAADLVLALLEHGAPPELPLRRESGLLHACAATRYNDPDDHARWLPIIDALLDAGADPNLADRFGVTPWGFAHDDVRPRIARRGARPTASHPGLLELRAVLAAGSTDALGHVAADSELLDFYDASTSGCTAPLAALLAGNGALADALFARKERIDINEAAALGDTPRLAALLDELDVVGPRAGSGGPDIPLHLAAWRGEQDAVELLLDRGYSPAAMNRADEAGRYQGIPALRDTTPLHAAAEAGQSAVVARLLDVWHAHWSVRAT